MQFAAYHICMRTILTLYPICYFYIASVSINNTNSQVFSKIYSFQFNSFENNMENGTFAP